MAYYAKRRDGGGGYFGVTLEMSMRGRACSHATVWDTVPSAIAFPFPSKKQLRRHCSKEEYIIVSRKKKNGAR